MYNHYNLNLNGFAEILFLIAISFIWSMLVTWRIGAADNHPANFMMKIGKIPSIILFLYSYKRKITVWGIMMQICNYLTLIVSIIIYKLFKLSYYSIDRTFVLVILGYMGTLTIIMMADFVIYLIKNSEFF